MQDIVEKYFTLASRLPLETVVTDRDGSEIDLGAGFERFLGQVVDASDAGNTLRFIGNGGSAGIASHMAVDYAKRGGIRAQAMNDPSMLTCLGNDLGYEQVFAHQVELHTRIGDVLTAISSSGRSPNILAACKAGRALGASLVTFSGFDADNPLRGLGDLNFYVASPKYGFVELTHMALLGAAIDIQIGWPTEPHLRELR